MSNGLDLIHNFDDSVGNLNLQLKDLTLNDDRKFADKLDVLLNAKLALLPLLTNQLQTSGERKTPNRTSEVNSVVALIGNIETSLYRKKEMEAKEEVDLSHPKIQKALEWVIEATTISLRDAGVEDALISNYIIKLAQRMVGFEEEANKRLKGVAFTKLETVDNPLIELFQDIRKQKLLNPSIIETE
jgi:hypothetical protein